MATSRVHGSGGGRVQRLAQHVLRLANSAVPRTDFVASVIELVIDLTGAETVEIWLGEDGACARFLVDRRDDGPLVFTHARCCREDQVPAAGRVSATICGGEPCVLEDRSMAAGGGENPSTVPLRMGEDVIGWLRVRAHGDLPLSRKEAAALVRLAETLGVALVNQRAQAALRERVKELTGLYRLSQLAERPDIPLDRVLQGAAESH